MTRSFLITRRQAIIAAATLPFAAARAQPAQQAQQPRIVELRAGETALRGGDQPKTPILGFDGQFPGPLLKFKRGQDIWLKWRNGLDTPASFHVAGLRAPNALDGVSPLCGPAIAPGGETEFRLPAQESGTYIVQPMAFPGAAALAGQGAGCILAVEEETPPEIDLELPFALADWRLDDQGRIAEPLLSAADAIGAGRLGALMTINGAPAPARHALAPHGRVRLRIANLAMAQIVALTFEGATPLVAAIDSQPCDPFEPVRNTIPAGPGARFDMFFDMPAQEGASVRIILRRWPLKGQPEIAPLEAAVFTAQGKPRAPLPKLAPLQANDGLPPIIRLQDAKRLDLTIARTPGVKVDPRRLWSLNGRAQDFSSPPLFSVKRGTPVTLGFVNRSEVPHVMRVHGHTMRQLHLLDDGWEPYWRDGVVVPEQRTVRIAFLAVNPGRWRLGSGILAHAEAGLNGWFEVT